MIPNQITKRNLPGIVAPDLVKDQEARRVMLSLIFCIQWILDNWPISSNASKKGGAISGGGATYTFAQSVLLTGTTVTLKNDSDTPGNNKYYGTNASGVKGFYSASSVPAGGSKYMVLQKNSSTDGDASWDWVRAH